MEMIQNIEFILQNSQNYFVILFFMLGASMASFFNVVVFRLPVMMESDDASAVKEWLKEKNIDFPQQLEKLITNLNLSYPSSHCYSCNNSLKWYHNIPVFSYIFLRGKCGFCHTKYSWQYPLVELIGGLIAVFSYLYFIEIGFFHFILALTFLLISFLLILIDFKTLLLPDNITIPLLCIGLLSASFGISLYNISLDNALYAAFIGYGSLWLISTIGKLIKGQEVMGGGDLKLLAALGAFIGIKGTIFVIFFAPFIGIITWLVFKLLNKKDPMIPYGPSLILASLVYLFAGELIIKLIF